MNHAQLDSAFEKLVSTLQRFQDEIEDVRSDWGRSIGVRDEEIPKRRIKVAQIIREAQEKVEKVRTDFDFRVDRGA